MLTITDLRFAYGDRTVLDIPTCTMAPGVHGIVGLNGAGKSTLLNALYGFGRNTEARVEWNGTTMGHTNTAFQEAENYFHPGITGREYLELFMSAKGAKDVQLLNELLEVPLDTLISTYSTGMKRKLTLLGALCLDREVLLLDEPMNGLDLASVRVLEAIIKRLTENGRTVVITSHVLGPLVTLCDHIHLLQHGCFTRTFERGNTDGLEEELFADMDKHVNEVVARWK
ncbi:MAG: ATP-binding cassette domain-containing protein [Flavobacteriales bacterium]|nr:ATP-binding cassette domain-containing protein [Flavobacteriales bacterium]